MEDLIADDRDVGGPPFGARALELGVAVERPDAMVVVNPIVADGDMMGATVEEHAVVAAARDLQILDFDVRRAAELDRDAGAGPVDDHRAESVAGADDDRSPDTSGIGLVESDPRLVPARRDQDRIARARRRDRLAQLHGASHDHRR